MKRAAWARIALALLWVGSIQACTTEITMVWGEKPASEGISKNFDVAISGTNEVPIGTMPWRAALDVYVNVPPPFNAVPSALLGSFWKLYAVTGTTRVAIAGNATVGQGSNYVVGVRNVVCDHYLLTVQAPAGEVTVAGHPLGQVSMVAWGTNVTGPPIAIPNGFPDPANSALPSTVMVDPFKAKGGEGAYGTGARHAGPQDPALVNFRLAAIAPNVSGILLVEMIGYTTAAGQNWIQLFDSPGPSAYPANGAVSVVEFPITQNQGVAYFPQGGFRFQSGLIWALSSTPRVMTQVGGTTCWFDTSFYQ